MWARTKKYLIIYCTLYLRLKTHSNVLIHLYCRIHRLKSTRRLEIPAFSRAFSHEGVFGPVYWGGDAPLTLLLYLPHCPTYIDFRPNMLCRLAWLVAGCNKLGGRSLWYRTDCGTVWTVLFGASHSHVPAQPIFSYKWGAAGGGECWLECSYEPPEGHPVQLVYTFVICILSMSRTPKFQHFLSAVTLGISLVDLPPPVMPPPPPHPFHSKTSDR